MDLHAKINEFVAKANEITARHWVAAGYTYAPSPIHKAEFSDKWCKVFVYDRYHDGTERKSSIYAFVAMCDNETKQLGKVAAGDIHKAATYKAPAKHARGNVFKDGWEASLTPYGIVYLK